MTPKDMLNNEDTASRFFRVRMTAEENKLALQVSVPFMAYLQNKIEAYAHELVSQKLPYSPDPTKQVEAILAHERLRNFVEAFEELMSEIVAAAAEQ